MESYQRLVRHIIEHGERRPNRTGIDTLAVPGYMFEHNMAEGFPLLTTKRMPFKLIAVELEGFIKGITDKRWYQERGCHIWDEWCNPQAVPHDLRTANLPDEKKAAMKEECDLGPIYGRQWRNFHGAYTPGKTVQMQREGDYVQHLLGGFDQLAYVVEQLKSNPDNRRLIISAWNPLQQPQMALPPCHFAWQVLAMNGQLHLLWNQRSVDVALGLPFNIASYALLLHLLALETKMATGKLIGFLGDTHIYEGHLDGLQEQIQRMPRELPWLRCAKPQAAPFSIFEWAHEDMTLEGYRPHPRIKFEIAV